MPSTHDLDLEKIHKGIFTHDKAKMKWIMKRLKNRTPDYPRIHSSTLYSSGVFNILLATRTSTLSIMVLEKSVHAVKPNTTQIPFRQRKGYSTISYVGFMAMTMRRTALLDCVYITPLYHFLVKNHLHYTFLKTTLGPWGHSCRKTVVVFGVRMGVAWGFCMRHFLMSYLGEKYK